MHLCWLYFGLLVYPLGYSSGPAGLHACMCERSGDRIYEWCRLSVSPSRRVWQTGRKDAAAAAHTVHWYNRWIPLAGSLSETENVYLSKHTDLLPSRPVSSDGRRMDFDRESASRSNEKSDDYYATNLPAIWITLRALHIAHRCCSESIPIIYKWK